ncbi:MAG: response regulator, partial [Bacteroidota bacterium]
KDFDVECRFITARKNPRWVRASGSPRIENGKVIRVIGLFQDITNEKTREGELQKLNRRFKLAQKSAGLGVWDFDPINNVLIWDEKMYELYDVNPNDFEGEYEAWSKTVHPDDIEDSSYQLALALEGKKEFDTEFRVIHQDKSVRHMAGKAHVSRDENGQPTRVVGVNYDITDKVRDKDQINLLESVVKHAKDAVLITKAEPIDVLNNGPEIIYVNPAFCKLTGYSPEDVLGKTPRILQGPGSDREELNKLKKALENWDSVEIEIINYRKDGSEFWANFIIAPIADETGWYTHWVSILRDVSSRKKTEFELISAKEQALASSVAKTEFLSTMSHEIRTPLNAIIGMTSLLSDTELSDEQQQFLTTIRTGGESLLSVINDILDYSKIESGNLELEKVAFDVIEPIEETLDLLSNKAFKKGLELLYMADEAVPITVDADITRIRQVLVNLVGNAIKFTSSGEILVKVHEVERKGHISLLQFSVSDTGIGIPEEKIAKLFKSFSQVDASTTRKYGGTGLGLAISKKLVELHGGRIWVESEINKGSTFHFTIQAEISKVTKASLTHAPLNLSGKNVWILDDNHTNLLILEKQLASVGIEVKTFSNPLMLLETISQETLPDLAILDMHMPEMDGIQVAQVIRKNLKSEKLPLMLLSSVNLSSKEIKRNLFNCILQKPARKKDLFRLLHQQLSTSDNIPGIITPKQTVNETVDLSAFHILLAEDNKVNQRVAQKMLAKFNVKAEVANNGLEAIAFLKLRPFDLILMDMQMPEMDGVTAAEEIRKMELAKQPIILAMTANASKDDRDRCLNAGMNDFITKPIKLEGLRDFLKKYLLTEKAK